MNKVFADQKGETLIEALASILIACLAVLMLLTYVGASKNLIDKSDKKMNEYYDKNNSLNLRGESDGEGKISFSNAIVVDKKDVVVEYFVNDTYENNKVVVFDLKEE